MIYILSFNTSDHLCLACLHLILAVPFKMVAAATSPEFRMSYKYLNRETKTKWETWSGLSQMAFPAKLWRMVFGPALLS